MRVVSSSSYDDFLRGVSLFSPRPQVFRRQDEHEQHHRAGLLRRRQDGGAERLLQGQAVLSRACAIGGE